MNISAVIITKDEEENLKRCLRSIQDLADEVVVVDSGSTDKTVEIAKKFGAKIYNRSFDNYASQRNFAIEKASKDWILSLDADEEIPKELVNEIKIKIYKSQFDGYLIPRKNIIFGKEIKFSRYSPDKHVWLFRKRKGKFENSIHEEIKIKGKIGELENAKIHHSHKSVTEFLAMTNSYTEYEAETKIENKNYFSFLKLFYYPIRSFVGRYFLKQGFRDGLVGFVLCSLRAYYHFITWLKVWEKEKVIK